jgi:hypothetical protein
MITKWIGQTPHHKKSKVDLKIQGQIQSQMKTYDLQNRTKLTSKINAHAQKH